MLLPKETFFSFMVFWLISSFTLFIFALLSGWMTTAQHQQSLHTTKKGVLPMFENFFRTTALVSIVTFGILSNHLQATIAEDFLLDFDTLSLELSEMDNLFQVSTEQQTVVFDSESATRKGFSLESIKLAEEMATFTNKVVINAVKAAKRHGVKDVELINIKEARIDINKYPSLAIYFREASVHRAKGLINGDFILRPNGTDDPKTVCGSTNNPVPSSAAAWTVQGPFDTKQKAEQELSSLGYYKTSKYAGGGYTRNQTYNESICKKDTYRDQALDPYKSTSDNKWYFKEQNYTGNIPGEPNPVMSIKPSNWPYLTWPVYVRWWHKNF